MDITGKIHSIDDEVQITDRFTKQKFILDLSRFNPDTGELFENYAEFQINNQRVDMSQFKQSDKVKVNFYVSGRFWEKKDGTGTSFFQNLICTGIEKVENNEFRAKSTQQTATSQTQAGGNYNDYTSSDAEDDLPF